MTGRTNAGAGVITLYTPELEIYTNTLYISNTNGNFADEYDVYSDGGYIETVSIDSLTLYLPDYIFDYNSHSISVIAKSNIYQDSPAAEISYMYEEVE